MLKFLRENPEAVRENIVRKNEKASIDAILELDEKRRSIITEVEYLKNQRNVASQDIARLKKEKADASEQINSMKIVSDKIKSLDDELRAIEAELDEKILYIPNMLDESVPTGRNESDNPEIRRWGNPLVQTVKRDHISICKELGLIDFDRGAKVSGSGFLYYTGKGATLERALINYMINFHTEKHGYKEMYSPFIVSANAMQGTGQIPKMAEDMYYCEKDELYLIPTAEVPLTNYHSGDMLVGEELPIKLCGYSPCFRREAGSYGKETRGLLRLHQFNKVELVKFANPKTSYQELELLVTDVEEVLQSLNLHYRVILLCSADTSFSSAKTYDLEVWSPADEKWLEVSSCSNFIDFQAWRANIRYKETSQSKPEYVHTLNGSGLATPRMMVAILENYIQEDGTLIVPEPLRKYTGFDKIEKK
ncbi:MAG: serine--tRNA ligase [Candidatus Kapabacteria bacterium]|nr:serine--tRNA ligase [Candidatus Kapabacteria bacterium]